MAEAAAVHIVAGQRIQNRQTVLDEAAVLGRVDAQSGQCHDDLSTGFAVLGVPAAEATGSQLQLRQHIQRLVHSGLHSLVLLVVGSQRLNGHCGHVRICVVAAEVPAAVGKLGIQDHLNQLLAGHIAHSGIVVAIQGNKGENGAVDALGLHIIHVIQTLQQVMAAHIGDILADSGEGQDHPGVVGNFGRVQTLIGVSLGLHILHHIVIVPGGHGVAAAGQADDHPLAADGVHRGGAQGTHEVAGGLVNFIQLLAHLGHQLGVGSLGGHQHVVVRDQSLLGVGQLVISRTCGADGTGLAEVHRADCVDQGNHFLGGLFLVVVSFVFLGVVIGIVEHNHVALVEVLLRHAQIGVYAVEGVHPAGEIAVGELAQGRTVLRGDGLDIVPGFVLNAILAAQRFCNHIQHRCVVAHGHCHAIDPLFQVAVCQSVLVTAVAVNAVAQQGEGNRNILAHGQKHRYGDLRLGRAVGQRYGLFTTLVGVKAGDLNIFGIHNRISLVHRPMRCADHSTEVKGLSNRIRCLVITGNVQFIADRRRCIFDFHRQVAGIFAQRIICTIMILSCYAINIRERLRCIKVCCAARCFMRFTTGIHIIHSSDALFGPAALQVSVSSNVVKLIQAAIVSDDAAHILCAADFAGKSITCNGVLIPSLIYRSVSARNTTDILSTGNISTHSAALN